MCFRRKKKNKKGVEPVVTPKVVVEEPKKEEPAEKAEVEPQPKQEVKEEPVKVAPKEQPKKPASKPAAKPSAKAAPEPEKIDKTQKYHISQNNDEKSEFFKQWRVRKSGSNKTIKYFQTQKEAIDFAKELAKKYDSDIVIHKMDGKIRKRTY